MALAKLSIDIVAEVSRLEADMRKASAVVERSAGLMRGNFEGVATALRGVGAAAATVVGAAGALVAFVQRVNSGLLAIKDLSEATGASIENISALENVARNAGGSLDDVSGVLIRFNSVLKDASGNKELTALFRELGLSAEELRKQDPAVALRQTAIALARFADDGDKARAVQVLFGKSVAEAGPLLKELAEQTEFAGSVTRKQVEAADRLNKEFAALKRNAEDLERVLAGPLVQALNRVFELVREGGISALFTGGERGAAEREVRAYATAMQLLNKQLEVWVAREQAGVAGAGERVRQIREQIESMLRKSQQANERLKDLYRPEPEQQDPRPSLRVVVPQQPKSVRAEKVPRVPEPVIDRATVDALRAIEQTDTARIAALTAQLQELYRLRSESGGAPAVVEAIEATRKALEALDPQAQKAEEARKRIESLLSATDTAKLQRAQQDIELLRDALSRASDPTQIRMLNEALWQTYEAIGALPEVAEDATQKMKTLSEQAAQSIQNVLGEGLENVLTGRFDNILQAFANMLTQMVARALAADIMNAVFKTGSGGNLSALASAFSSLFGGARADGGPVTAGRAYLVGERGPELFMPRTSGTVVPNVRAAGRDSIVVNINMARGTSADEFRASARQMAVEVSRRIARVRGTA